jgi:hypothetical protein
MEMRDFAQKVKAAGSSDDRYLPDYTVSQSRKP